MAHLTTLQGLDPQQPIPPLFEAQSLINSIDANEQKSPQIQIDPTINKFRGQTRDGGKDDGKEGESKAFHRRFSYLRHVQCTCCTTYGHDIDKDVCKIGAQVHAAQHFILNHGEKAVKNAKAYALANSKMTLP